MANKESIDDLVGFLVSDFIDYGGKALKEALGNNEISIDEISAKLKKELTRQIKG